MNPVYIVEFEICYGLSDMSTFSPLYNIVVVIFDPASFYGHHEFDLAIAGMFGGFTTQFYDTYHQLIPKAEGFAVRHKLYTLFHYLNHWYVCTWHNIIHNQGRT